MCAFERLTRKKNNHIAPKECRKKAKEEKANATCSIQINQSIKTNFKLKTHTYIRSGSKNKKDPSMQAVEKAYKTFIHQIDLMHDHKKRTTTTRRRIRSEKKRKRRKTKNASEKERLSQLLFSCLYTNTQHTSTTTMMMIMLLLMMMMTERRRRRK